MIRRLLLGALLLSLNLAAQNKKSPIDKFRQLEEILPTSNDYRTASGAPGHKYWQQRADYDIDVELDDQNQKIIGRASITYHNNSPDTLTYLWLQLDQNIWEPHSDTELTADVDAHGLRLRYPTAMPPGRFLWLDIEVRDGDEPVHALGEVVSHEAVALALDIKFKHLFPDQRRRLLAALGQ